MTAQLERSIGRVEGKVDGIEETLRRIEHKLDVQDARITKVENRQYYFMGGGAVIGSLLTFVASYIKSFIASGST